MTVISKRQRARFYRYKKREDVNRVYIQKSRYIAKGKTIYGTVFNTKIKTLYVTQFFMKFFKLAFI